jgi:hypothetical protein
MCVLPVSYRRAFLYSAGGYGLNISDLEAGRAAEEYDAELRNSVFFERGPALLTSAGER